MCFAFPSNLKGRGNVFSQAAGCILGAVVRRSDPLQMLWTLSCLRSCLRLQKTFHDLVLVCAPSHASSTAILPQIGCLELLTVIPTKFLHRAWTSSPARISQLPSLFSPFFLPSKWPMHKQSKVGIKAANVSFRTQPHPHGNYSQGKSSFSELNIKCKGSEGRQSMSTRSRGGGPRWGLERGTRPEYEMST